MKAQPLDVLRIRDLVVRCIIGVQPEERKNKQDILINIALHAELRRACQSDKLEDSIDYKTVKCRVLEMVENSRFFLLERLAQRIAEICLDHPLVRTVEVNIQKPGALRFARCSEIEIVRHTTRSRPRPKKGKPA